MKIQNKYILTTILFVLMGFVCVAQIDGTPPPPMPPPPPGLPIDNYIIVLFIAALIYGIIRKSNPTKR